MENGHQEEIMTGREDTGLDYNTQREKLLMPEYGRNVQKMVDKVRAIPNKAKRDEQAEAVVKVMEILNTQVHSQENYEQKLWDHLYMISGFDLDIDAPYPMPEKSRLATPQAMIPVPRKPINATHYGRTI